MLKISRSVFFPVLASICLICGCGNDSTTTYATNNTFQAVVFSDIHFYPFDDESLFPQLVSTDASGWATIFQGSKTSITPSAVGSDTNYPLLVLTLSSIKLNVGASPIIIYTGDILGHKFAKTFYTLYGVKGIPDAAAIAAMKAFTDKTVAFIMDQVRLSVGNIPVVFTVGNSDSYSLIDDGPDSSFLANNAERYYTKFLNSTGDHQAFLSTFQKGGYYSVEPPETNLMVIGLNTVVFSPTTPGNNDSAVAAELDWLDSRLAAATAGGKKVWLLMHIPPGADIGTTAKSLTNGHLAKATMMWKAPYQTRFLDMLANYPGVISLTLAAHTHMDEYRIMSPSDVLEITPGISPYFNNNPAFKIFTFSRDTLKPADYRSINYDLATMPVQFNSYYTFSTTYFMQGPLDASLEQLFPALVTNNAKQKLYTGSYYSGNNSLNPINTTNWPVYWCGIGNMNEQAIKDCVNHY